MTKRIELTQYQGAIHYALVDDEDFTIVNQYRWHLEGKGNTYYAFRKKEIKGRRMRVSMHRFILALTKEDKCIVDHRNFNGLDNRRSNIRIATHQDNSRHSRKHRDATVSYYKGVHWEAERKKWRAYIYLNKKKIWLGRFAEEVTAAEAYNAAAVKMFVNFAVLNKMGPPTSRWPLRVRRVAAV